VAVSPSLHSFIPGQISVWSGTVLNVPAGWTLCDGTNGTPDLRDKFVVGAGSTYAVDATGGTVSHEHELRTFDTTPPARIIDDTQPADVDKTTSNVSHLPPYWSLAYIMNVG